MRDTRTSIDRLTQLKRYLWSLVVAWIVLVAGLLAWDVYALRQVTRDSAINEARAHLKKDLAFRLWATTHGGFYVPTDDRTPPNPYLAHVPERDIETPSGRRLTLMNPAYAQRQRNEEFADMYGVAGHLTSLNVLRPENAPDSWERATLEALEQGEPEVHEFTEMNGEPHVRLMQPLIVQEGCLKCHGHQGYQVGDVRGGISVSVPMAPYLTKERQTLTTHIFSLSLLWVLGFVGIGLGSRELRQSIRERDQAEEALREERATLAQRVAERTAELSRANAELERASRLKDEFLANMSHELRTPLNAILGMSEALQEQVYGPLNDKQSRSLRTVEQSGRHLLSLINDILDVSKIEAGKVELEIGSVSVEAVSQASLGLIKQAAHEKRITVNADFDNAPMTIQADERRLKQILVNLLTNAVKFTPEGGAMGLEVSGDAGEGMVHFSVWDTGIGISQEDMAKLFKPFVQLDSSLSRQHSGTGLGLALVSRLTESHGGRVSLESKEGQGTRFTVSLPWEEGTGDGWV